MSCSEEKRIIKVVVFFSSEDEQKVDLLIDGQLFTSYIYNTRLSVVKKSVLFPIIADNGVAVTRDFLDSRHGESVDHPRHIGAWFNFGDLDGLEFLNNSNAINGEQKISMGVIYNPLIIF